MYNKLYNNCITIFNQIHIEVKFVEALHVSTLNNLIIGPYREISRKKDWFYIHQVICQEHKLQSNGRTRYIQSTKRRVRKRGAETLAINFVFECTLFRARYLIHEWQRRDKDCLRLELVECITMYKHVRDTSVSIRGALEKNRKKDRLRASIFHPKNENEEK